MHGKYNRQEKRKYLILHPIRFCKTVSSLESKYHFNISFNINNISNSKCIMSVCSHNFIVIFKDKTKESNDCNVLSASKYFKKLEVITYPFNFFYDFDSSLDNCVSFCCVSLYFQFYIMRITHSL